MSPGGGEPNRRPPMMQRFRVGGEVIAGAVQLGVYFNLGELGDFFAGWFGFDPARDDGVEIGGEFHRQKARLEGRPRAELVPTDRER